MARLFRSSDYHIINIETFFSSFKLNTMSDKKIDWECMYVHSPKWLNELETALCACMSIADANRCISILDEYNQLTEREESQEEDAFSIFGIEEEKFRLVNEFIALNEKYKKEAQEFNNKLKTKEND